MTRDSVDGKRRVGTQIAVLPLVASEAREYAGSRGCPTARRCMEFAGIGSASDVPMCGYINGFGAATAIAAAIDQIIVTVL